MKPTTSRKQYLWITQLPYSLECFPNTEEVTLNSLYFVCRPFARGGGVDGRNNSPLDRHMAAVGDPRCGNFSEMGVGSHGQMQFFLSYFLQYFFLVFFLFFSSSFVVFLRSVRGKLGLFDANLPAPNLGPTDKLIRLDIVAHTREPRS